MLAWEPNLTDRNGPRYRMIADALIDDIENGRLAPGTRLPTHRDLAWHLSMNVGTVTRAYAEVERRGLIGGEVGRGTYVRGRNDRPAAGLPLSFTQHLDPSTGPNIANFSLNYPALVDAHTELAAAMAEFGKRPDRLDACLRYQYPGGRQEHRIAGARWLQRHAIPADSDTTLVTAGVQHAIAVAIGALTRPGDTLLMEELSYPNARSCALGRGLTVEPVALDRDGLCPDAFEAAIRRTGARVAYLVPTIQNPTASVMPEDRRRVVVDIARRHDVTLIEDAVYHFLPEDPPPTLYELAPERTVLAVGLSKIGAPGLRIGHCLYPAALGDRLVRGIAESMWMASPVMAEVGTLWMNDGSADRMMVKQRVASAQRQSLAAAILPAERVTAQPSGHHLWLELPEPWRATQFAQAIEARGVRITPAETFVVGRAHAPHAVRVSLASPEDLDGVERGLKVVADLMTEVSAGGYLRL